MFLIKKKEEIVNRVNAVLNSHVSNGASKFILELFDHVQGGGEEAHR